MNKETDDQWHFHIKKKMGIQKIFKSTNPKLPLYELHQKLIKEKTIN